MWNGRVVYVAPEAPLAALIAPGAGLAGVVGRAPPRSGGTTSGCGRCEPRSLDRRQVDRGPGPRHGERGRSAAAARARRRERGHGAAPPDADGGAPEGWADVFSSNDYGLIRDRYRVYTGHDPALTYQTHVGTLTISQAWLAANEGNGRVRRIGGRWIVERYQITGTLRVTADNITFGNIHQDSAGVVYGFQSRASTATHAGSSSSTRRSGGTAQ